MGMTKVSQVWVVYEDGSPDKKIIKHELPPGRLVSPMSPGDLIVFASADMRDVYRALPDTYDGINCFRILEVHHRWDQKRDFGTDDVIPVLEPAFSPILENESPE